MRRDRAVDHVGSTVTLVLAALPEFVIGIGLVLLFATSVFHWFPAVSLLPPGTKAWEDPQVVVLPAATLVLAVVPYISRIMRGSMIEVLESEYVTMARLKGLSERTVIWRHAVPNAIVPAIQVTALQLAWMAGGVVVVEFVFSYPGIGAALVDAVDNRDMPVVQTVTMLAAGGLRGAQPARRPRHDRRHAEAEDGGAMSEQTRRHRRRPRARGRGRARPAGGPVLQKRPWLAILRNALRLARTRIGLGIVVLLVAVAVFGPLVAPHSPTEFIAVPNSGPSGEALFGADALGRDVLSRFLHGGLTVLWLSAAATIIGVVLGVVDRARRGVFAQLARRRAHARQRRRARLPADHPRAAGRLGARAEAVADRAHRRHHPRPARRARHARRRAGGGGARLRQGGRGGGREALADRVRRGAAERDEPAAGRARPAHDLLDRPRGGDQLPRLRPAAADRRLGPDDQREPALDHGAAVVRAAAHARRSACSRSARTSSRTASPGPRSASTEGAGHEPTARSRCATCASS